MFIVPVVIAVLAAVTINGEAARTASSVGS